MFPHPQYHADRWNPVKLLLYFKKIYRIDPIYLSIPLAENRSKNKIKKEEVWKLLWGILIFNAV